MRRSKVLSKLRRGEISLCAKLNLKDASAAEIACRCGFDCIWLDMEHVPNDWNTIENQINRAKVYDVDTVVRVSKGSYSDYIKPLEIDSSGIMVPHVMSLKEAKELVWKTRFHPIGRRPADGGNADGGYCMMNFKEYIKAANKERFVIVQIEDPEALGEIDEIAKLDGIDMLFFGPGDFSQGIGKPGDLDAPEIENARMKVAEIARKNNKFAGTVGNPQTIDKLTNIGYQFINVAADVIGLSMYFKDIYASINKKNNKLNSNVYSK
jgi:4-hydroxy-2-oxoheptanedioate aldolase